jgi:hypothetical protein
MDCILMMWGIRFADFWHHGCQVYIYIYIYINLLLFWAWKAGLLQHPWKKFHWLFLRPQELFAPSNPGVTPGSSFVDDFWGHRGCLRCPIHGWPVEAVSLIISEATWGVCAVESTRHPWKKFHWLFLRPQELFALSNPGVTPGSSFVDDFWGHRGCLRCRIHAWPVEAVSLIISEATWDVCAVESERHPW